MGTEKATTTGRAFGHPKDLIVGSARIPWGLACRPYSSLALDSGWVLPGGERTLNFHHAHAVGLVINGLLGGPPPAPVATPAVEQA